MLDFAEGEWCKLNGKAEIGRVPYTTRVPIQNERELEFAVFCIENVAEAMGRPSDAVYRALAGKATSSINTCHLRDSELCCPSCPGNML